MELDRGSMAKGLIHDYRLGQSLAYRWVEMVRNAGACFSPCSLNLRSTHYVQGPMRALGNRRSVSPGEEAEVRFGQ